MLAQPTAAPETLDAFLAVDAGKGLLRFFTCGSVDDGKSTLIGRLLYEARGAYEDQLASIARSPVNRSGGAIDLSLLTDGLRAEREQGITIDVAYRHFATARRRFLVADTPGHEQYTRNMATGASTAHLAVLLLDARNGVRPQSRRHAAIAGLLGIPHALVAVNKMDLVHWSHARFLELRAEFAPFLERLGFRSVQFLPVSALDGDNVTTRSAHTPWYDGPTVLEHLETVPLDPVDAPAFRFPVQLVVRPDAHFRGYAGQVAGGRIRPGDRVVALPSGRTSRVRSIVTYDGDLPEAHAPLSVTLQLEDELDISRGDLLAAPDAPPHVGRHFEAQLVWMQAEPLKPGQSYLLKHTTQQVRAVVRTIKHRLNIEHLSEQRGESLGLNDIGTVVLETSRPIVFDPYRQNRLTGAFILVDLHTNQTAAAGMVVTAVASARTRRVEASAALDATPVTPFERRARDGHAAAIVWLPPRPELAWRVERLLFGQGRQAVALPASDVASAAEALLRAGLLVIAGGEWAAVTGLRDRCGADRVLAVDAAALPASDEEAAQAVLHQLEQAGVLQREAQHGEGEGI